MASGVTVDLPMTEGPMASGRTMVIGTSALDPSSSNNTYEIAIIHFNHSLKIATLLLYGESTLSKKGIKIHMHQNGRKRLRMLTTSPNPEKYCICKMHQNLYCAKSRMQNTCLFFVLYHSR